MNDIILLHNKITENALEDEKDVLDQVEAISEALEELSQRFQVQPFDLASLPDLERIMRDKPSCVFNLVESVNGKGSLVHLLPSILSAFGTNYTGAPATAIFTTSHKVLAKSLMNQNGIPTSPWRALDFQNNPDQPDHGKYIIKSVWEHASIGLDDASIVDIRHTNELAEMLSEKQRKTGSQWFAEKFIDGREFNLSVIETDRGPQVLQPAEMRFENFRPDQPKIVGYRAKWDGESFEYQNTNRTFEYPESDEHLLNLLKETARKCWAVFGLRGYARVDFRVDECGNPFVLEVNANPCLSKDAGFAAALNTSGIPYSRAIQYIVQSAGV